ncbi:MAG: hypothetical protein HY22_05620 [[Candidatus Thermochlorobacteriaceae] bacterium GBChlB]|nr:MAG: hypothetical protein HY22_05620 [[Candidatus Thermochlorobacteriaceae] bacterium GBChlB]
MKKLGLLLALFLISSMAQAQLPTLISIRGGVGGGLSVGSQTQSVTVAGRTVNSSVSYSGWNILGKAKITPPISPFTVVGLVSYNSFSGSVSAGGTTVTFSEQTSVLNPAIGIEFNILPIPILSPYLAADLGVYSTSVSNTTRTRTGIGVGAGAELSIPLVPIAFDLEAKYRFANLIGKENNEEAFNYFQVSVMIMFKIL